MLPLTYAELFAGAGGMSLGLEAAGWTCVAHAEIEPHARAVVRKRWPECRLDGDVTQLNGADYCGITMLTGGSPCQDLSIAGKRKGMTEGSGTRSSLFFEQIRIWQESQAPLLLWENVVGAYSSNGGKDFGAVLSAIVGAAVPVPADGWRGAGVASGPAGVAAWRTLDAQYFGVPQRRRRIFVLGARAGVVDPAEVLSLAESLSGNSATQRTAAKDTPADARRSVASESRNVAVARDSTAHIPDMRGNGDGKTANTFCTDHQGKISDYGTVVLRNREGKQGGGKGPLLSAERSLTLGTTNDQVVFTMDKNTTHVESGQVSPNRRTDLAHDMGPVVFTAGGHGQFVDANAVSSQRANGGDIGGGSEALVFTKQAYGQYEDAPRVDATLGARDHAATNMDIAVGGVGIPRRLTPKECERLMGWPDLHTSKGVDEKGREYALADTPRYKLCGNGIASPVAQWIGWRLRTELERRT